MSEWKEVTLNELGRLERGKSKHRPRYAFHLYGGPYPFVQTGDVKKARKYIREYSNTYSEAGLRQSKLWKKGTLCITIAANIAEIGILDFDACFPDSMIGFVPDKRKANLDFVYYLLQHFQRELKHRGEGSVQDNINLGTFHDIAFPVPELGEQQAIAGILSSLDDKIDLLHRQNQTLEALAQTLFRHWFIDNAQDDWEEKPLDEIADYLNGLACQKYPSENDVDRLPVLKIKELRNGLTDQSDWATNNVPREYIVENGDVVFSWSGSLMVKIWDGRNCVLNQHLFKVTSEQFPKWFYYLWTIYHLEKFTAIAESKATTMGHIKRGDLSNSMTLVPTSPELSKLGKTFSPLIEKMILNNRQSAILTTIRDRLLPKLMSGEVRILLSAPEQT